MTTENTESKLKGQASEDEIKAWKSENKDGIYAAVSNGTHIGYFRNPKRGDVNAALAAQDLDKPLAIVEEFGRLTFIGGAKEILEDDEVFFGVSACLRSKMNGKPAKILNL